MIRDRCPQPTPISRRPSYASRDLAQASIEFVGTLPLLLIAALCCLQALLVALGVVFSHVAVDRAAREVPHAQVVASVPKGWRSGLRVTNPSESRVRVSVRVPAVLPGTGQWLRVAATSEVMN